MQNIGDRVTVNGKVYILNDWRSTSSSGSKFFGRFVFTLLDMEGNKFTAYGKRVAHNSRLTPVAGA